MKRIIYIVIFLCTVMIPVRSYSQNDSKPFADHLKNNAKDPVEFVLSKLRDYRVVAIGEDHWIADHTPFLCEVLRASAKDEASRPNVVALEFGNEIDQATVRRVTHSAVFMPDSVIKILQHAPDVFGNPYKEYFDVFKCIWEINSTLADEKKIFISLLDPAGVQNSFNQTSMQRSRDRDMSMFEKLRADLIYGNKVLFYAGQAHTQRQVRGYKPRNREIYYNYPSAGFLIKSMYPNDVYTIDLWAPVNMGLGYEINPQTGKWFEKGNGIYDKAFEINGNEPCGFDIAGSVWSEITMVDYFSPHGKGDEYNPSHPSDANPYTRDVCLSQLIDGIVFIKPSSEFRGGTLIDIYTPDFIEVCRRRSGGSLDTPSAILKQIKEWHPLMELSE